MDVRECLSRTLPKTMCSGSAYGDLLGDWQRGKSNTGTNCVLQL